MAPLRDLAVVVLGATGVTGRPAVAYLRGRAAEAGVRWGIAGRDRGRLEALVADWPADVRPELLEADSQDPASLDAIAGRCRAVVNFAGPFARLAPPVIAACVRAGTHYIDVTGEIDFVARTIEAHHDAARERGIRIVQVAGIEALPFDLLTRLGIERLDADHGATPESAELVMTLRPPPGLPRPSDGMSRGTLESLGGILRGEQSRLLGDPAALVQGIADVETVRRVSPIELGSRRGPDGRVLAPMLPSPELNPPVIQRSVALAGLSPICYRESLAVDTLAGPRPMQIVMAGALSGLSRSLRRVSQAGPGLRSAAARMYPLVLPHSSSGPRPDRAERWTWRIDGVVRGRGGAEARVHVDGRGHTGYLATSRMTAEAGLLLADADADLPDAAGCLTPAAALGTAELDRFAAAQLVFGVG